MLWIILAKWIVGLTCAVGVVDAFVTAGKVLKEGLEYAKNQPVSDTLDFIVKSLNVVIYSVRIGFYVIAIVAATEIFFWLITKDITI